MNRQKLVELLENIAENDLEEGSDLKDHPCSVAIKAIHQCFDDIGILKNLTRSSTWHSKKVKMLLGLPYNPEW